MKRQIIFNADDFGWDRDASAAILDLASEGKVDSTTVMANMVDTTDLKALRYFSELSVGVHLNLSNARPLSPVSQIFSLVDTETGNFYSSLDLWKKFLGRQIKPQHIQREIQTQLDFLADHGVQISHADSHQHIHIYPVLGHLIQEILKKRKIKKLRNCRGRMGVDRRRWIIRGFNQFTSVRKSGFRSTDALCSAFSLHPIYDDEFFFRYVLMDYRDTPLYELMLHPALTDRKGSPLQRVKEYQYLKTNGWQTLLDSHNIVRLNWNKV